MTDQSIMDKIVEVNMHRDHPVFLACVDLVRAFPPEHEMNYIPVQGNHVLLQMVAELFEKHGHGLTHSNFSERNSTIEIHHYLDFDGTHKSPLEIHLESQGDFLDSETFVCYLINNGIGGEFGVYGGEAKNSLIKSIDTHPTETHVKCLIFDETVWHGPRKFSNGERLIVSVHIRHGTQVMHDA